MRDSPPSDPVNQFANFLRNHDELDLGRLTDEERRFVFDRFAPEPDMRLYERGIRRRLPPMLDDDQRRIRMAYSLMFSMPGTPIVRYGEEIGMGDDLSLQERSAVRTVMQWSPDEHGGFSSPDVPAEKLVRPAIREGAYGYLERNVRDQERDGDSLLNWMRSLIRVRRDCPECGYGSCTLLDVDDEAVLAHECRWGEGSVLTVHNLGEKPTQVAVRLAASGRRRLVDLFADDGEAWETEDGTVTLDLGPYGFHWFRCEF